jgi:hypothetical protein
VRRRAEPCRGAGEQGGARLTVCMWNIHGK